MDRRRCAALLIAGRAVESVDGWGYGLYVRNDEVPSRGNDGRCGAQLRGQPGVYCQKYAVKDRTRCRLHGGKSPTGADHPSFLHGRRSRYRVRRADYNRARHELALARVLYDRAVAAGSSGVAELRHVVRCVTAYARLVEGKVLPDGAP